MPIRGSVWIRTPDGVGPGTKNPANRFYLSGKMDRGWSNDVFIPETPEQQRTEDKNIDKDIEDRIDRSESLEPFTAYKRRRNLLCA